MSPLAAEIWAGVLLAVPRIKDRRLSADRVCRVIPRGRPKVAAALAELHEAGLLVRVPARRTGEIAYWLPVREADEATEPAGGGLAASAA